ncbi:MAG TPA: hypothetical protein VHS56_02085 [Candidatus Cybelea sp.]|jgi:hypothetical protein|nr:hypothetical protein [Candidatus Cybelea sp.]
MKSVVNTVAMLAAAVSLSAGPLAAPAATINGGERSTPYVAAFAPIFGTSGIPRSGTMTLAVSDGTISGKYTGTSVGPDPLDNHTVPVIGTVSQNDGYVQLYIGMGLTLRGTMSADGKITGTASDDGRLYEFTAAPLPG